MIQYLILTFLATGLAYGLYLLFLKREKSFGINRFYLLGSLALCFLAPMVNIDFPKQVEAAATAVHLKEAAASVFTSETVHRGIPVKIVAPEQPWWPLVLLYAYCAVTAIFIFRFGRNIFKITRRIGRTDSRKFGKFKLIPIAESGNPFCFFRYIFIHRDDLGNKALSGVVLQHEMAHGRQYHSIDILFAEILICFFWFNPFVWLYKKAMVENHEFLADAEVLRQGAAINAYAQQLIDAGDKTRTYSLLSGFNFSQTKTRIIMLYKKRSSTTKVILKSGLVLGLFAFVFSLASFTASSRKDPFVVVVNAGHGGKDPGAKANNAVEKTINLQVAKKLAALSSKEVKIILVRDKDEFVTLMERARFADKQNPDMFLGIHCTVFSQNTDIRGIKVFRSPKGFKPKKALEYGKIILTHYLDKDLGPVQGISKANFLVLRSVHAPALTLELGFLSNKKDVKKLTDPNYQEALAKTIYSGLLEISKEKTGR